MLPLRVSGSAKRVSTKFVVYLKVRITTEKLRKAILNNLNEPVFTIILILLTSL